MDFSWFLTADSESKLFTPFHLPEIFGISTERAKSLLHLYDLTVEKLFRQVKYFRVLEDLNTNSFSDNLSKVLNYLKESESDINDFTLGNFFFSII